VADMGGKEYPIRCIKRGAERKMSGGKYGMKGIFI
jgi:hypothetical protein